MKKTLAVAAMLLAVLGCSDNKLTIVNESGECGFTFNFRAKTYNIDPGGADIVISKDIPNGTYDYGTIVRHPAGTDLEFGSELTGSLTFEANATEWLIIYGSKTSKVDSTTDRRTIQAWATKTTSDPSGIILAP
jgi:hypothetical protein